MKPPDHDVFVTFFLIVQFSVPSWAFTAAPISSRNPNHPSPAVSSRDAISITVSQGRQTLSARQYPQGSGLYSSTANQVYYYTNSTRWMEEDLDLNLDRQWNDLQILEEPSSCHLYGEFYPTTEELKEMPKGSFLMDGISDVWKARLLLIGAAALYGTNFSLVKLLGDVMPVGVSTSLRFAAAVLATLPWLLQDIHKKDGALMAAWLGFEVGLWNSIGYVSQAVGLDTTPAAESAFICSLAVVTVPIIDFFAGRELKSRQWIGAFLAVIGVALLELVGGGESSGHAMGTGDLLTLVQPFAFGIGFWRMEQAMHRFPDQASRMTAAQLLAVFMASLSYGLWDIDIPTLQSFPWKEWMSDGSLIFSLLWTGIVTTAMTIYMENKAMETLSAAETTLIFSTEPLWGTAFAAVVMGEHMGPNVALGAIFILSACLYSNLGMQGIQRLVSGSVSSVPGLNKGRPIRMTKQGQNRILPLERQWAFFSTSAASSAAWWKVAASNLQTPSFDDALSVCQEIARDLL